jgi:tellurite methyltransferase
MLAQNIAKYRKLRKLTQEELAQKLNISFQAVSKWETGQSQPDASILPELARYLDADLNALFGYSYDIRKLTIYEEEYRQESYYWGVIPSQLCYRVLEMQPPVKPVRLLDVGCGEGRNAVFFAKNGYCVTGVDITDSGIEKTKRLADLHRVSVNTVKADLHDFRLETDFDIIFSSGVMHYMNPESRREIIENYQEHTSEGGLNVFNVFIRKPFIAPAPENEPVSYAWKSGEMFTYYTDWLLREAGETIFDCDSSGIPHRHCMDHMIAERIV